jgi:hypothetical protein
MRLYPGLNPNTEWRTSIWMFLICIKMPSRKVLYRLSFWKALRQRCGRSTWSASFAIRNEPKLLLQVFNSLHPVVYRNMSIYVTVNTTYRYWGMWILGIFTIHVVVLLSTYIGLYSFTTCFNINMSSSSIHWTYSEKLDCKIRIRILNGVACNALIYTVYRETIKSTVCNSFIIIIGRLVGVYISLKSTVGVVKNRSFQL